MPIILALLILLSGCSSLRIDNEFQSYITSFEVIASKYKIRTLRISTGFDKTLSNNTMGTCQRRPAIPNKISINPAFWYNLEPNCREALIFHEMMHCALDLEHDETMLLRRAKLDCVPYSSTNRLKEIQKLFKSYR